MQNILLFVKETGAPVVCSRQIGASLPSNEFIDVKLITKYTIVRIFTPWKWVNTTNLSLFLLVCLESLW